MNITHSIIVDLATKGALGGSDLTRTESKLKGAESSISRLGESLRDSVGGMSDAFTGAVEKAGTFAMHLGVAAGAAGIAGITYGVMKLNTQLESTTISLGTIFSANGLASSLPVGMQQASNIMTKIRADAKALPGETEDLLGIFKAIAIPGARAGADINRLESLSANIMAASAVALGSGTGQMEMAAREASQLLAGRAGAHNILGSTLFGLTGERAQEFNKKSDADRLKFLEEGMKKYGESTKYFNDSMDAQTSTLKDTAKNFIRLSTEGVFGMVKGDLRSINDFLASPEGEAKIKDWSARIGHELQEAWALGRYEIEKWGPPAVKFAEDLRAELEQIWTRFGPSLAEGAGAIRDALQNGTALKDLEKILTLYGELKVAKPVLSAGSSAFNLVSGSGLGSVVGGALSGEGAGVGALGIAGGATAFAVLAAAALGAAGELHALADTTSKYHVQAKDAANEFTGALNRFTDAFKVGVMPALDAFGVRVMQIATWAIDPKSTGDWSDWVDPSQHKAADDAARDLFNQNAYERNISGPNRQFGSTTGREFVDALNLNNYGATGGKSINDQLKELYAKQAAAKGPAGTGTHIQKVEIVVSSNADPSRVAQIVMSHIVDLARNPKQSPDSPNYSADR